MPKKNIIIVLFKNQKNKIKEVVEKLKTDGFNLSSAFDIFGIITGSIDEESIETISKYEEIEDISDDKEVSI